MSLSQIRRMWSVNFVFLCKIHYNRVQIWQLQSEVTFCHDINSVREFYQGSYFAEYICNRICWWKMHFYCLTLILVISLWLSLLFFFSQFKGYGPNQILWRMAALEYSSLSVRMELAARVQILDKAVCISLSANVLGKGMNPSLPQAMGK